MTAAFDFLVLGGGSAGYAAARTAREFGERVAIVDGSETLGGLCILRGCMPSKTMIYSAELLHLAQRAEKFGLRIPEASADLAAIQRRKRHWIDDFAGYRQEQLQSERFHLFRQRGRLRGPREVELADGTVLRAERILIATGSVVAEPPLPGLSDTPYWTSDEVLDLDALPRSVIVLGGGIIACELGQFLARVGSQVTMIQRSPRILKEAGPDAGEVLLQAFRDEGIELWTDTEVTEVAPTDRGVRVRFRHGGREVEREADHLFNALGRRPNTEGLNLAEVGVATDERGRIVHDGYQRTVVDGIYAAGDCAGPAELVHVAVRQGEVAARHAFGDEPPEIDYDALMVGVFTDPQVAWVGLRRDQAEARGLATDSAEYPFEDHGKSLLMEAPRGFVRVTAERATGRLLGAECVGKDATELIHALSVPVALGLTVRDCLKADWYHPTLAEIWTYPLEELAERAEEG